MTEQKWRFLPDTKLGRWTVWLIAVMPVLFILGSVFSLSLYESAPGGSTILSDIVSRPLLALSMLAGMAAGVAGFITGLLAIFKHKEKALLVYLTVLIGGLVTLYLAAEFIFPH